MRFRTIAKWMATDATIDIAGRTVPFGVDLLFQSRGSVPFTAHVEICEDVWVPQPPSTAAALAGAEILPEPLREQYHHRQGGRAPAVMRVAVGSLHCRLCLFSRRAGRIRPPIWPGMVTPQCSNTATSLPKPSASRSQPTMAVADVDLALLRQERMRVGTFSDCIRRNREAADGFRTIVFDFEAPQGELQLMRSVDRYPFVPSDPKMLRENCYEAYNIQISGSR